MTRYVFDRITRRGTKKVVCTECGKKLERSKTFEQTVNPWNAHPDGTPRTRDEVWARLGDEIAAWETKPERCSLHDGYRQYGSVDVGGGR